MLPYVWLSLAIVCLWLRPQASPRALTGLSLSAGWLLLAIAHGYATGIVSPLGVLVLAAFGSLCYRYWRDRSLLTLAVTILFSLALMAHVVPGFSNVLVVKDLRVGPTAVPYSLYFNFDKAQTGLFLLAFGPPLLASRGDWATMLLTTLAHAATLIALLMACSLAIGQVRLETKVPAFLPYWLWANLLFTCVAEEALFRAVIQRRLQGESAFPGHVTRRSVMGLAVAGTLFGLAHYAGGVQYVLLATIAGVGYGWIYWRTNRIEASILTHFLVNTAHIVFFTYPALA